MSIEDIHKLFLNSNGICTDSRKISPGCLYISLKGERFDGNDYAVQALADGADHAIIDKDLGSSDARLIMVNNGLKCLQNLATFHRRFLGLRMLAITGSNGKTTTKELCGAVLSKKYNLLITSGNFNNHIGVPLTLLHGKKEHDLAVIEMGANHQREIAELCQIAQPNVGLITNIGKAHLEGMGGIEGVIKTKSELYHYLMDAGGSILLNSDEKNLLSFQEKSELSYGSHSSADIIGKSISETGHLKINWSFGGSSYHCQTNLLGAYNLGNILSAIAVGVFFDVPPEDINAAISEYSPSNNRSELQSAGTNTIIWDAYNANPSSMMAAIENLAGMHHGRKIMILGEMKEVGPTSDQEHQNLIDEAQKILPHSLFLVGNSFEKRSRNGANWFTDVSNLKHYLADNPLTDSLILIKGSRSNKLEELRSVLES